ncbi:MAG: FAD-dependent oxidoreductase [Deltaproteobacteria bacterium]|nr:FAD-dependent oxidoreductase [Deltaproteobacteria bacterium]
MKQRIAIIGGGVAGLTAAYLLHRRYDVALFERQSRLGGNAYTLHTDDGHSVDIAVAAFGRAGYKQFYRLLDELGVDTCACAGSLMSFHDLDARDGLYMTPAWSGLRRQRFDILRPHKLGTFFELARRISDAVRRERAGELDGMTVANALDRVGALSPSARAVALSVFCLLSSMSGAEVLAAPASFFFRKIAKHNDVVSPRALYSVRAVVGRTQRYVAALAAPFLDRITLNASIAKVLRARDGVTITFADGQTQGFDHVVFACNADQALRLLAAPTPLERELLGAWRYKDGRVVVHRDHSAFPADELIQAYTFLYRHLRDGGFETSVNGSLRHEPGVAKTCDLISSQHPNFPIDPTRIVLDTVLRTPIFDFAGCATQRRLPMLNGRERSYYCGSHFGFGLHEDAVRSAIEVAAALGVRESWSEWVRAA